MSTATTVERRLQRLERQVVELKRGRAILHFLIAGLALPMLFPALAFFMPVCFSLALLQWGVGKLERRWSPPRRRSARAA